jgi:hypothetical protein
MSDTDPQGGTPMAQDTDNGAQYAAPAAPEAVPQAPQTLTYTMPAYTPPAVLRTNGLAVAALVLGIVSFFLCYAGFLTGILGTIFGIVALVQINRDRQTQGGQGMAITGVILSPLALVLWLVVLLVHIAIWPRIKMDDYLLRQTSITIAVTRFKTDTGVYPRTLDDLGAASAKALTYLPHPEKYDGPYDAMPLKERGNRAEAIGDTTIPENPYADDEATVAEQWRYDAKTGKIDSAVPLPKVEPLGMDDD